MTFRHRAGVSPYTSSFDFAETCVFAKQLLGPLHCDHIAVAPLLPKLRGHFAEFLNKDSPVRLRILILPTCVGLRYGRHFDKPATFLASVKSHASLLYFAPSSAQPYVKRTSLLNTLAVETELTITRLMLSFCVIASFSWRCRNLNLLSIAYDFRPRLRSRLTLGG